MHSHINKITLLTYYSCFNISLLGQILREQFWKNFGPCYGLLGIERFVRDFF